MIWELGQDAMEDNISLLRWELGDESRRLLLDEAALVWLAKVCRIDNALTIHTL